MIKESHLAIFPSTYFAISMSLIITIKVGQMERALSLILSYHARSALTPYSYTVIHLHLPYYDTHYIPYHTVSYYTIPYHNTPYITNTIPYHTAPYQAGTTCGASSQADLTKNLVLKTHMLRFSRHSRQKCRKLSFLRQKRAVFSIKHQYSLTSQ